MEYGSAISNALSYARHSKATLAFSAFFIGVSAIALILAALLLPASGVSTNPIYWLKNSAALGPSLLVVLIAIATLGIGGLALTGAVIRNAVHDESLSESWKRFSPRFATLLGIVAITMVASFTSNMLFEFLMKAAPVAYGVFFVLSIAVSLALAFFLAFAEYAAVLDGSGVQDSLRRSIQLATQKPVDVFMALTVSGVVAFIMLLALMIALLLVAAVVLVATRASVQTLSTPALIGLGVVAMVGIIGVFFTHVFQYHFMAHAYADIGGNKDKAETDAKQAASAKSIAVRKTPAKSKKQTKAVRKPGARRSA